MKLTPMAGVSMDLTPVESSHIAAIGYLEVDRVLLVRYKDGSLSAFTDTKPERYAELMAAHSKGMYLYAMDRHGRDPVRINGKGPAVGVQSKLADPGPLKVLDPEADKCCVSKFRAATAIPLDRNWVCDVCGTEFHPEMHGPSRYWRIMPLFAVHRRGL